MMNPNTIQVFERATEFGLKLGVERGDTLTSQPVKNCPPDFVERLRAFKYQLLALLQLPFVMVYSEALGEAIFFAEDKDTKAALVEAGAEPWSVYTRDELQILTAQNRLKPLTQAELRKVHQIKRIFGVKIAK